MSESSSLMTAVKTLTAGIENKKEIFIRLGEATRLMCDPFPLPEISDKAIMEDRRSVEIPIEFKTRMTGDLIRLCLLPGIDELKDNRLQDVFTLMRIMIKYRVNMPEVVWLQLYEIALKNFIDVMLDDNIKKFFREINNDPEVQKMVEEITAKLA